MGVEKGKQRGTCRPRSCILEAQATKGKAQASWRGRCWASIGHWARSILNAFLSAIYMKCILVNTVLQIRCIRLREIMSFADG